MYYTKSYHRVLPDVREQKSTHCQVSRGLRHLCCKVKGQSQKRLGNNLHLRGSDVSPGMQVQQHSKHKGFIWWSTPDLCWDGRRHCFSSAFLPLSSSGDSTFFSRSGSTSMPSCCSFGVFFPAPKFQSQIVMGTRNRHNACSFISEKFSKDHQLVTSHQFSSKGTVTGLCMRHQWSTLHDILGVPNISTFVFVSKSKQKNINTKTPPITHKKKVIQKWWVFTYLFDVFAKQKPWCTPSHWQGWFVELIWFILWNINPCYTELSPL